MEEQVDNQFSEMDGWTREQVAQFKQSGRLKMYQAEAQIAPLQTEERATPSQAEEIGTFVAEGDSWFDYLPGTDLIDCLRNHYDYLIENYAKAGDTLENMVYGTRIDKKFNPVSPTIDQVLLRVQELQPKIFLFSGGGNDALGQNFDTYLNHQKSGLPPLREDYLNNMVNVVYRKYLEDLIAKIAAASPETKIVMHGYGYTIPTGEGVDFLFITFTGPWLRPVLAEKDILAPEEQRQIVDTIIGRYNSLLTELDQQYEKFNFVDLRPLIDPAADWTDELHLRNSAFARAAAKIHETIQALF
ncbi:MAG: GDSL-type esterase/lipase family protein [Microcoleaceae cyanobacterium]